MLLSHTERGLYCAAGDFYIDPWQPVDRAVITHAHGDHARWGSARYLAARTGERVLRTRLGPEARIECVDHGDVVARLHHPGDVAGYYSFAGHVHPGAL